MKERKLTIVKASILVFAPIIASVIFFICYRLVFNGAPITRTSYATITIYEYVADFLTILVVWYAFKKYSFSFHLGKDKLTPQNFLKLFFIGIFFFVISSFIYNLKFFFTSASPIKTNAYTLSEVINYTIGTFVLAPVVEELLFKNILDKLRKNYSIALSVICVSLLFTLIHSQAFHWYAFPKYLLFSVVSCVIFLKTESILLCIFFHFLQNLFVGISTHYDSFLYENVYTQYWYIFILIFSVYGIFHLLSTLRK